MATTLNLRTAQVEYDLRSRSNL